MNKQALITKTEDQNYFIATDLTVPTENGDYVIKATVEDNEITYAFGESTPAPTGTKQITTNGTNIDVAEYAAVDVAVPASAVVSGKKTITTNGTNIDVTTYAKVDVNVSSPEPTFGHFRIKKSGINNMMTATNVWNDSGTINYGYIDVNANDFVEAQIPLAPYTVVPVEVYIKGYSGTPTFTGITGSYIGTYSDTHGDPFYIITVKNGDEIVVS